MTRLIVGKCCGVKPDFVPVGTGFLRLVCPHCGRTSANIAVSKQWSYYTILDRASALDVIAEWNGETGFDWRAHEQGKGNPGAADGPGGL